MKIVRNKRPDAYLGTVACGSVVCQVGEGPRLFLVGDSGLGAESDKRHMTDLEDGTVIVAHKETKVVKVEGEFVCKH
jgi:hypothetical protein